MRITKTDHIVKLRKTPKQLAQRLDKKAGCPNKGTTCFLVMMIPKKKHRAARWIERMKRIIITVGMMAIQRVGNNKKYIDTKT